MAQSYFSSTEWVLLVRVIVAPRPDLPQKEWQVEVRGEDAKVSTLKGVIEQTYGVIAAVQKISVNNFSRDLGLDDEARIQDLPDDSSTRETKKVYLFPAKGKESKFTIQFLDWARRNGCIRDFRTNSSLEDEELQTGVKGRFSRLWRYIQKKRIDNPEPTGQVVYTSDAQAQYVIEMPPLSTRLWFNCLTSFFCLMYIVANGLEADYSCWGKSPCKLSDRFSWFVLDVVFTVIFVVETGFRVRGVGPIRHFLGDPLAHPYGFHVANCLDFVLVVLKIVDTFILQTGEVKDTRLKIIVCFRIMQFGRVAKLARVISNLRELWLIMSGMGEMFLTLLWVMTLLVMIYWVIGIVLTIIIGQSDEVFDYKRSDWTKEDYFGSVPKSMMSLFQIMTFSQWSSAIVRPVMGPFPWIFIIIVPFMCLTTVGLLNIIVGVIVETTLSSAASNREKEAKEIQKMHTMVMESLQVVFEDADTDKSGVLDREELHKAMKKPFLRERMKLLEIPLKDLDMLFSTLDEDGSGEVKTDTFFRNCSRLRGPALASDMHRMSVDFGRYIQWADSLGELSKETSEKMEEFVKHMDLIDREIIKGDKDVDDPVLKHRRMKANKKGQPQSPKRQSRPLPERFAQDKSSSVQEHSVENHIAARVPTKERAHERHALPGVPETHEAIDDVPRTQSKRSVVSRRSSLSNPDSVMGANLRNELRPLHIGEQYNQYPGAVEHQPSTRVGGSKGQKAVRIASKEFN